MEGPGVVAVVTGAAGFLGAALVDLLVARGGDVVAIDRRPVAPRPGDSRGAARSPCPKYPRP